jgi:hypothetical protein
MRSCGAQAVEVVIIGVRSFTLGEEVKHKILKRDVARRLGT